MHSANAYSAASRTLSPVIDTFTISPAAAAPEPASWALMLGGFGLVGGALRNRRRVAISAG